jgi:hypothetical protein
MQISSNIPRNQEWRKEQTMNIRNSTRFFAATGVVSLALLGAPGVAMAKSVTPHTSVGPDTSVTPH